MKPALSWILRLVPAIIIGQTIPFKFMGAAEPVRLFTDLAEKAIRNPALEGVMRLGTGVVELLAVVLLLIPKHSVKGALLTTGTMLGALASHAFFIGFADYGPMPAMAVIALIASVLYLFASRAQSAVSTSA